MRRTARSEATLDEAHCKKWGRTRRVTMQEVRPRETRRNARSDGHAKGEGHVRRLAMCEVRSSLPCEGDAMQEEVQSMKRCSRCDQCEKSWWCWEHYGNFLDITDGPEVGDAALNLYLENCPAINVM